MTVKSAKPARPRKSPAAAKQRKSAKPVRPTGSTTDRLVVEAQFAAVEITFPIVDPTTGRRSYRYHDNSWLECDPISNQVGMYCHEVKDSDVPQSIRDRVNTSKR